MQFFKENIRNKIIMIKAEISYLRNRKSGKLIKPRVQIKFWLLGEGRKHREKGS